MIFTREQYDEITGGDELPLDELPIALTVDQQFELFNTLPRDMQGQAITWGITDTEWHEKFIEHMVKNLFGYSLKEYYQSDIAHSYFEEYKKVPFDFKNFINETRTKTRFTAS